MIRTVSVLISILRVKDINIVKIFAAPVVVIPDAANLGLIMVWLPEVWGNPGIYGNTLLTQICGNIEE